MTRRMRVRPRMLERLRAPKVIAQRVRREASRERALHRAKKASQDRSERKHVRKQVPMRAKKASKREGTQKASHPPHTPPHTRERETTRIHQDRHAHAERSDDRRPNERSERGLREERTTPLSGERRAHTRELYRAHTLRRTPPRGHTRLCEWREALA